MPIRLASALPDSPAVARNSASRTARAVRLALAGLDGGTVKAGSSLRQTTLQIGPGSDVVVPRDGAVKGGVPCPACIHDPVGVGDQIRAAPRAVLLVMHRVEPAGVEQPVVRMRQIAGPGAFGGEGDDADVLAGGDIRAVAGG